MNRLNLVNKQDITEGSLNQVLGALLKNTLLIHGQHAPHYNMANTNFSQGILLFQNGPSYTFSLYNVTIGDHFCNPFEYFGNKFFI